MGVDVTKPMSAFHPKRTLGANVRNRPIADIRQTGHHVWMRAYADVDDVIAAWVKTSGSMLFTEWADAPARFFHVPGDPPFECFQVSVRVPEDGQTAVTARAIDTNEDTDHEMGQTWEGPVGELDEMLGTAMAAIEMWRGRGRTRPDLPSP